MGYLTRKLGNQSKPLVTIESGGEESFSMKTESLVTTSIINFKLGEPFEEITGDGRKVLSTMSMVAEQDDAPDAGNRWGQGQCVHKGVPQGEDGQRLSG